MYVSSTSRSRIFCSFFVSLLSLSLSLSPLSLSLSRLSLSSLSPSLSPSLSLLSLLLSLSLSPSLPPSFFLFCSFYLTSTFSCCSYLIIFLEWVPLCRILGRIVIKRHHFVISTRGTNDRITKNTKNTKKDKKCKNWGGKVGF